MQAIKIPSNFNYIAVFLTMDCNYKCSYCINQHHAKLKRGKQLTGRDWVRGLNRIKTASNLPITFQGGEPTLHKDFFEITNCVKAYMNKDLLTNLSCDVDSFIANVPSAVYKREAPYASIRVSYHHGQSIYQDLIHSVYKMMTAGYDIGVWEVDHPRDHDGVAQRMHVAKRMGIDWRTKEFLGMYEGKLYGTMRYDQAVGSPLKRDCECKTSELIIAPDGHLHRCHSDLYQGISPIGHLLDEKVSGLSDWRHCKNYGDCNACDIKVTTNRFQEYGHSSVEVKNVKR